MSNMINTKQLTRTGNDWCAEISDFGPDFRFAPVYSGGREEGIVVFSHVTGNNVSFVRTKVLTAGNPLDNEISGWVLEPCATDRNLYNLPRDLTITLFND